MLEMLVVIVGLVRGKSDMKDLLWGGGVRLRCPKCGWQPQKEDRWSCNPAGCGHVWNTFETGGHCPGCSRHWKDTACLSCGAWSEQESWYTNP